ncbi:MAG: sulfite oxidase heme-binding subunit YedZ [Gemmatimonadaceae bacterium]
MAPLGGVAREPRGFGALMIVLATVPAVFYVGAMIGDLFYGTRFLGTRPIEAGEHNLGKWTLRILFASLAITPLRRITGWNWLAKHRRTLGLFAFAYLSLHLLTWTLLDVQLFISEYVGWPDVQKDLLKRPYITVGMLAFLLMIPLAVTSTKAMIARLGKRWRVLHRLVYVIAILGVTHFFMAVKKDIREPLVYAVILALLLGWRVWEQRRSRLQGASTPAPA